MRNINLAEIIEKFGLKKSELAAELFPENKHPNMALKRVIDGESDLDSTQISRLSMITGVPINNLYSGADWKMKSLGSIILLTNNDFRAELNTSTWITRLFAKDSLFHEAIIHSGFTPLSEYINELNLLINKYKSNESN